MDHVSDAVLGSLRAGREVRRRDYAHVDACLHCRRALGAEMPPRPAARTRNRLLIGAFAATAVVASVATVAPLRAAAFGFVEIFEPQHVVLIPMTVNDFKEMSSLPDFNEFGTSRELVQARSMSTTDIRVAENAARFRLRLPAAVARARTEFSLESPSLEEFAFSDARARAAATLEKPYVPMPPGMDGSVIRVAFGGLVTTTFGSPDGAGRWQIFGHHRNAGPGAAPTRTTVVRGNIHGSAADRVDVESPTASASANGLDGLILVQMPVPKVGTTGAFSAAALERYIIDRPGVSPRLAAAFESLRDPSTTLPIPVPLDRAYAQNIAVDGVQGTLIGDETGLGAGIFWQRNGYLYALGGMRAARDIVAVANTLQ